MVFIESGKLQDVASSRHHLNGGALQSAVKRSNHGAYLTLADTIPLEDSHGKSFFVGKRGATTGLTFGVTNDVEAVICELSADGKRIVAWEHIVVSLNPNQHPFSARGESGSAVFDANGRVLGIVTGGYEAGKEEVPERFRSWRNDLKFVSPIQVVFDDIEEFTGCVPSGF